MSFKDAVKICFRKYADFNGRARRSEYWFFYLFKYLVMMVLTMLTMIVGVAVVVIRILPLQLSGEAADAALESAFIPAMVVVLVMYGIILLCALAMFIPTLAVSWRRLHDIGKSGACWFLNFVPLVGPILLLVWFCRDSQPEGNRFGPCPKDGEGVSFKQSVVTCLRKYLDFTGRARRSEFWFFMLFIYLVQYVVGMLVTLVAMAFAAPTVFSEASMDAVTQTVTTANVVTYAITGLVGLALFIPTLAVTWRRLHDIGKSGAKFFLGLIPLVGPILLLVWVCRDSQSGPNRFGPDPKEPPVELPPELPAETPQDQESTTQPPWQY